MSLIILWFLWSVKRPVNISLWKYQCCMNSPTVYYQAENNWRQLCWTLNTEGKNWSLKRLIYLIITRQVLGFCLQPGGFSRQTSCKQQTIPARLVISKQRAVSLMISQWLIRRLISMNLSYTGGGRIKHVTVWQVIIIFLHPRYNAHWTCYWLRNGWRSSIGQDRQVEMFPLAAQLERLTRIELERACLA